MNQAQVVARDALEDPARRIIWKVPATCGRVLSTLTRSLIFSPVSAFANGVRFLITRHHLDSIPAIGNRLRVPRVLGFVKRLVPKTPYRRVIAIGLIIQSIHERVAVLVVRPPMNFLYRFGRPSSCLRRRFGIALITLYARTAFAIAWLLVRRRLKLFGFSARRFRFSPRSRRTTPRASGSASGSTSSATSAGVRNAAASSARTWMNLARAGSGPTFVGRTRQRLGPIRPRRSPGRAASPVRVETEIVPVAHPKQVAPRRQEPAVPHLTREIPVPRLLRVDAVTVPDVARCRRTPASRPAARASGPAVPRTQRASPSSGRSAPVHAAFARHSHQDFAIAIDFHVQDRLIVPIRKSVDASVRV